MHAMSNIKFTLESNYSVIFTCHEKFMSYKLFKPECQEYYLTPTLYKNLPQ
jgi:hypothetical protein